MSGGQVHSWVYGTFPPFSQLINNSNCNATTDYLANNLLLASESDWNSNSKLGDAGITAVWLDSLLLEYPNKPHNWTLVWIASLTTWYWGVWNNDSYLGDLSQSELDAYNKIWDNTLDFGYSCGNKTICNKLDIKGDPDVSGRGVRTPTVYLTRYSDSSRTSTDFHF